MPRAPSGQGGLALPEAGRLNFAHFDHLSEDLRIDGRPVRLVHLYCAAPDYRVFGDPEEGISCVDDVARAAVLCLRHYEIVADEASRRRAAGLLGFVLRMQAANGLFHNFVLDRELTVHRDHLRSRADRLEWWSARAMWALGTACRVLAGVDDALADRCLQAARGLLPHVRNLLTRHNLFEEHGGRRVPAWLIYGDGADATSELLLGLAALRQARPDRALERMIACLAEGLEAMRYGSMNRFPYGLHASNRSGWHAWGNAQTQALVEAGRLWSARAEARHFYPRLLVEGLAASIDFDDPAAPSDDERIAYGVRCMTLGLVRLFETTGDLDYARMAGLAGAWFLGNNIAGRPMYDAATGRTYDGLSAAGVINPHSGAESTVEGLYALLEVGRHPAAAEWLTARGEPPRKQIVAGRQLWWRGFIRPPGGPADRLAVVMDLDSETMQVLAGDDLQAFLDRAG